MIDLFLPCEQHCAPAVVKELTIHGFKGEMVLHDRGVTLKGVSEQDAIRAAYQLLTPLTVMWLFSTTEVSLDTEETLIALETLIGSLPLEEYLVVDKTFNVSCRRFGTHEYSSVDVAQEAGRLFRRHGAETFGKPVRADMKNPDLHLLVWVDDKTAWVGLNLRNTYEGKRDYKVFNNPHTVKGPVAASLLMLGGWEPGKSLLDCFAGDGVIAIEAALLASHVSPFFYAKEAISSHHPRFGDVPALLKTFDATLKTSSAPIHSFDAQLRNVTAAKKNAKIAGVMDAISFSKLDVEWLDTKLAQHSVDRIICQPLEASKHRPLGAVSTIHKQLFYQAGFVLSKKGLVCLLCRRPEDLVPAAEQYGFVVSSQTMIFTGQLRWWVVTYKRK